MTLLKKMFLHTPRPGGERNPERAMGKKKSHQSRVKIEGCAGEHHFFEKSEFK